ncbi:MAG: VOC family protein [SAR324 cluster bacterium]|nr:VOC family protein [SAR324 cluster bacterium]
MAPKESSPPELGSFVALDHVNLRVPDQHLATLFFLEGLGLTRDPYRMTGTSNMWVNIGAQQFHLPTTEPMPFPGVIGLVVPRLDAVRERLKRVAPKLKSTAFSWQDGKAAIAAQDPWGRRVRVHQAGGAVPAMSNMALAYVEIWVPKGSAAPIAAFYEQVIGAPCALAGPGKSRAAVAVGPHQSLRFVERANAPAGSHNNHLALYLTRYQDVYARMRKLKNLMEKHRFEQFRFNRILDLKSGKCLIELEHEMRSLYHGDYGRALVNRGDIGGRLGRVVGRDT